MLCLRKSSRPDFNSKAILRAENKIDTKNNVFLFVYGRQVEMSKNMSKDNFDFHQSKLLTFNGNNKLIFSQHVSSFCFVHS